MRSFTTTSIGLVLAAFCSSAQAADVTLYAPDYTPPDPESQGYPSQTGDFTVRPVSTAANGQTAYEVQFTATAAALVRPDTTSSIEPNTTPTTYTILADATKFNVAHTLSMGPGGNDTFVSDQECVKQDGEKFVCVVKGEYRAVIDSTSTSTDVAFETLTAAARPWYTIKDASGATPLRLPSGGAAMLMGTLTALGFAVGVLLV